jgi:L-rhamnose mutarotase
VLFASKETKTMVHFPYALGVTAIVGCLVLAGCDRVPSDGPAGLPPQSPRSTPVPAKFEVPTPAQRYCSLIALNPDREEDFRKLVKEIPAAVSEAIRKHGMRNYGIYLCRTNEQSYAIRYYEYVGMEHEGDLADLAQDPEFKRWDNACEECEVTLMPLASKKWWAPSQEVLHLD